MHKYNEHRASGLVANAGYTADSWVLTLHVLVFFKRVNDRTRTETIQTEQRCEGWNRQLTKMKRPMEVAALNFPRTKRRAMHRHCCRWLTGWYCQVKG